MSKSDQITADEKRAERERRLHAARAESSLRGEYELVAIDKIEIPETGRPYNASDVSTLVSSIRAIGLQELQPRRGRREQIARLDPRTLGMRAGRGRALDAVLHPKRERSFRAPRPRADFEPGDRGDRGQGLAAKPERIDARQIAVGNFRGRMALDAEFEIGPVHSDAVVADADQIAPARLDGDVDAPGAGVERVLDELLHRRGGPLDHFARSDPIDQQRIEAADGHGAEPFSRKAGEGGGEAAG